MSTPGSSFSQFRHSATIAIEDVRLQGALDRALSHFREARGNALSAVPDVEALRDHLKAIRQTTIANLAEHLETFERSAQANGAHVHWARTAAEASQIVVDIARAHNVKLVAKSKSMMTDEIRLNQALEAAGITPVETDLGEWIIQLSQEPPYHIIAPAVHKTKGQVIELFEHESGESLSAADIPALTAVARRMLRAKFLAADMGVSGGNLAVAETGSVVLVTNEGNGRMVTTLPRVHVAVMGIEKIAPTWDEAAVWLSLLARSATGQPLSIYTTAITGPARPGDVDGPQEVHVVLVDNGRSRLLNTPYEEVLQCLRCGACLNVCPVYREAGGHAYGSPYTGPIGAVVSPLLFGLEQYEALPHASSLCGACKDVCPVRIDLPRMLLALRQEEVAQGIIAGPEALAERAVAALMGNAGLWQLALGAARLGQRPFLHDGQLQLPVSFTGERRPPHLAAKSFRQLWAEGLEAEGLAAESLAAEGLDSQDCRGDDERTG
ncbi:MAG: iron-sulfur cluster-binding protein [Chloroflexi bacterium]|nr:iron-sulfur cluster-binding protein [Chloroflexota bacterium]